MPARILLIGDGAREHAIAERIADGGADLYAIMSKKNPAIAGLAKKHWICDVHKPADVVKCVAAEHVDLAFVSPDAVLAAGVSDALAKAGVEVASPLKEAARIEWDKGFMRNLLKQHHITGAIDFEIVTGEKEALGVIKDYVDVAIKPLGLTGGKGVRVSGDHFKTHDEAMEYVRSVLKTDGKILIEEKVEGEEFSLQAFSDGTRISAMPPVQDHKRAFANDEGPNTGGMGSYSTGRLLPFMGETDLELAQEAMTQTINAMRKNNTPFKGVLYGQFMATSDGVKIIEFNSRFGDPEAMNVLMLLKTGLPEILESIAHGNLKRAEFAGEASVVKYLVPEGYPHAPVPDSAVSVDEKRIAALGAKTYYASVYEKDGAIYTTKSRTFGMAAVAPKISEAERMAESACSFVSGPVWHRKDIGTAALIEKRVLHMERLRG
jgi:phosphoribosylamine--glycine ligase